MFQMFRNIESYKQEEGRMSSSRGWIVVTGGGSGIGRALVKYFSEQYNILTCGRRSSLLEETKSQARRPERVVTVPADISDQTDRERFVSSLPPGAGSGSACPERCYR